MLVECFAEHRIICQALCDPLSSTPDSKLTRNAPSKVGYNNKREGNDGDDTFSRKSEVSGDRVPVDGTKGTAQVAMCIRGDALVVAH